MSTSTPSSKATGKKASTSRIRKRKCKVCKAWYEPYTSTQQVCSIPCSLELVKQQNLKKAEAKHKARKRELTPISEFHKKAQAAFNAFIRERDKGLSCVSCGRMHQGQWHAGHYQPVGRKPALRYSEVNCHRQCSVCNNHHSGQLVDYRKNLITRVGLDIVEWLERDHEPRKWTRDELEVLAKHYREATRVLQRCDTTCDNTPRDY